MIWAAMTGGALSFGLLLLIAGSRVKPRTTDHLDWRQFLKVSARRLIARPAERLDLVTLDEEAESDLLVTDQTDASFQTARLRYLGAGIGLGLTVGFLVTGSIAVALLLSVIAVPVAARLTLIRLAQDARQARQQYLVVLSRFMEVASAIVSSGLDHQSALAEVTHHGSSESIEFKHLREALERARRDRGRLSDAYQEIGKEIRVSELIELGDALEQAQDIGAPIESVLRDRASVLDERRMAALRGRAEAKSEQMTVPLFAIAIGFIVFIGYPALQGLGS